MRKQFFYILLFLALISIIYIGLSFNSSNEFEIDAIAKLDRVVDGDTIWVKGIAGFKEGQRFKIRLADIDAPEMNTREGKLSEEFLEGLLENTTYIFLDVDDKYTYDRYGRVIAVVYVLLDPNRMEFLNINYYMVLNGMAEWVDYHNSWHPEQFRIEENIALTESFYSRISNNFTK